MDLRSFGKPRHVYSAVTSPTCRCIIGGLTWTGAQRPVFHWLAQ